MMREEIESRRHNKIWELVMLPKRYKQISSKGVFKAK